jgi:hypothetical protein
MGKHCHCQYAGRAAQCVTGRLCPPDGNRRSLPDCHVQLHCAIPTQDAYHCVIDRCGRSMRVLPDYLRLVGWRSDFDPVTRGGSCENPKNRLSRVQSPTQNIQQENSSPAKLRYEIEDLVRSSPQRIASCSRRSRRTRPACASTKAKGSPA